MESLSPILRVGSTAATPAPERTILVENTREVLHHQGIRDTRVNKKVASKRLCGGDARVFVEAGRLRCSGFAGFVALCSIESSELLC
jgi:hypothetical protein